MGETDVHRGWMFRICDWLTTRYRGQRVYVTSNLLVYPEEGNTRRHISPDCFVALDCQPGDRRTFKIWEEGKAPDVVFEVTSRATKREDEIEKPREYAEMGVVEYFLYDPTSDYLKPPLQGFRLVDGQRETIPLGPDDKLTSQCLGLTLHLDGATLVMTDATTGERLKTEAELEQDKWQQEQAKRRQEQAKRKQEQAKRKEAETRLQQLEDRLLKAEAEIDRLRKLSERND